MMSEAGIKAMRARQRAEAEAKAQAAFARELSRRVAAMDDNTARAVFGTSRAQVAQAIFRVLDVEAPA